MTRAFFSLSDMTSLPSATFSRLNSRMPKICRDFWFQAMGSDVSAEPLLDGKQGALIGYAFEAVRATIAKL